MNSVIKFVMLLMNPVQLRVMNQSMNPIKEEVLDNKGYPSLDPKFGKCR